MTPPPFSFAVPRPRSRADRLSRAQLAVLDALLLHRSPAPQSAADIERASKGRVSREGARIAGEHLERLSLVVSRRTRARHKSTKSPHYVLPADSHGWQRVVAAYLSSLRARRPGDWIERSLWPLLESDYYQKNLDAVVRDVLHEREVEARRMVWSPKGA